MIKHNIKIVGIGSYIPPQLLTNYDLHKLYGTSETWPETYLGIKERHWVVDEQTSDLGANAGRNAINDAGIDKDDIDLIIVATSSPDKISPSTACIVASKLNMKCPSFDINSVCSGFLYGLNLASSLLTSGEYKNILLIASEVYSKITDKFSREAVYFGDGAGAVVLSKSTDSWITTKIYADGSGKDAFYTPINYTFHMDGKAVFQTGITNLPMAINSILDETGISSSDIKYLVPHQPGIKMLEYVAKTINLPFDRVVTIMDRYANLAAASIPVALDALVKSNKINNGDLILLATIGSGWTWGSGIIKW